MATHTSKIIPRFNFTEALRVPVQERFDRSLVRARRIAAGYQKYCSAPCVPPTGASETELAQMEAALGLPLPVEYRLFLERCRYLKMGDGFEVGGFDHEGLFVTEVPSVSDEHRAGVRYLVFANYWWYADGDQIMFDLTDPTHPVVAYLHDHGPAFESFAPSFSLALWRLVHELEET